MTNRPAWGTAPIRCGDARCKWRGFEGDLKESCSIKVCPTCGCDSYMFMTPDETKAWERSKAAPQAAPEEALRKRFEALASDSYNFRRSRRGCYVNPAVARDWKWFRLGAGLDVRKGNNHG